MKEQVWKFQGENMEINIRPRHKIYIYSAIFAFFLVLALSFLVYNSNPTLTITGRAISDSYSPSISQVNFTKQNAEDTIAESNLIITELKKMNLSVKYIEDALLEANKIMITLAYSEILNSNNATPKQVSEATSALRLTDWKHLSYLDILIISENIKNRKELALTLQDRLSVQNKKSLEDISQKTKDILTLANTAFKEERYNETEKLLNNFVSSYEREQEQKTTLASLQENSKNFIQKNWIYLLISIALIVIIYYFLSKKMKKRMLKEKIERMKNEKIVIITLIKKIQTERFETKKLSGIVYNIRLKKYQDRLREIEQELPVLEKFLKKMR